jgi:AraC family transcriptional regulator
MFIRSLSDLSPTTTDDEFKAAWGCENCILWGRSRHADFGPQKHTLSIRAAWGGVEHVHLANRTIGVDDDNFLILNQGQDYSTSVRALTPVETLAVCFRPESVAQVHAESGEAIERALEHEETNGRSAGEFNENLQPHDRSVTPVLRFIKAHLALGLSDATWYDEQLIFLLVRMRGHQERLLERVDRLALTRRSTRREVYRRIGLATDFLHTSYARDIDLDTLAQMAFLSKYHFLRLFTLVHGTTPHAYLQRKRTGVAVRLLETTQLTMSEVSASVGFADESTLLRQMRRWTNQTPKQIRANAA